MPLQINPTSDPFFDHAAAEALFADIKDYRLSGRYRALRSIESYLTALMRIGYKLARLQRLAVSDTGAARQGRRRG